jgi:hypothetical protein
MFGGRKDDGQERMAGDNQKMALGFRKKQSKGVSEHKSILTIVRSPWWGQTLKILRVSKGHR